MLRILTISSPKSPAITLSFPFFCSFQVLVWSLFLISAPLPSCCPRGELKVSVVKQARSERASEGKLVKALVKLTDVRNSPTDGTWSDNSLNHAASSATCLDARTFRVSQSSNVWVVTRANCPSVTATVVVFVEVVMTDVSTITFVSLIGCMYPRNSSSVEGHAESARDPVGDKMWLVGESSAGLRRRCLTRCVLPFFPPSSHS